MSTINRVILVGNLGKDPEIKTMNNSKQVASFSIATSESWNDKSSGEKKTKTEWHNVVVFNDGLINLIKNYIHKGSKIYLEGSLQTRKWTDNNNVEKYTTEVILGPYNSMIRILSSQSGSSGYDAIQNSESEANHQSTSTKKYQENLTNIENNDELDDEIPF